MRLLLAKLVKCSMSETFHFHALLLTFCKKKKSILGKVNVELVMYPV